MRLRYGWLIVLLVVALLVAACGPEPADPTPGEEAVASSSPTTAPVGETPTKTEEKEPAQEPTSASEMPVDEDDWHILGSSDAPVTIVEYSDFQ